MSAKTRKPFSPMTDNTIYAVQKVWYLFPSNWCICHITDVMKTDRSYNDRIDIQVCTQEGTHHYKIWHWHCQVKGHRSRVIIYVTSRRGSSHSLSKFLTLLKAVKPYPHINTTNWRVRFWWATWSKHLSTCLTFWGMRRPFFHVAFTFGVRRSI